MLLNTIRIRTLAAVIGALTAGFVLTTTSVAAGPVAPFGLAPQVAQPMPSEEPDSDAADLPARFKRQVVVYNGGEAAGTIIIDTPNTYLYLVLGSGRAMRYGIGVGREGFTWSGVQQITKKAEWPDWNPPAEMSASLICRASWPAAPAIRSAPAPCISAARSTVSTAPTTR